MTASLHHLHLRLDHVEPDVEREFAVPSDLRLDQLHTVIQTVMGWEDCHLHEYIVGARRNATRYGPTDDPSGPGGQVRNETTYTLAQIAPRKGSRFGYLYDFGDGWQHAITVKAVLDQSQVPAPLHCLGATGACPPEDCGGPHRYTRMLEILADPGHEEYEDLLEWLDADVPPAGPDIDAVNAELARLARHWMLSP